jgi:hypothetical protein
LGGCGNSSAIASNATDYLQVIVGSANDSQHPAHTREIARSILSLFYLQVGATGLELRKTFVYTISWRPETKTDRFPIFHSQKLIRKIKTPETRRFQRFGTSVLSDQGAEPSAQCRQRPRPIGRRASLTAKYLAFWCYNNVEED